MDGTRPGAAVRCSVRGGASHVYSGLIILSEPKYLSAGLNSLGKGNEFEREEGRVNFLVSLGAIQHIETNFFVRCLF